MGLQIDKLGYSDIVTYTAVVNGLCEVDKAKKLLQVMHTQGIKDTKPNTVCVVHCSVKWDVLNGEILRGSQGEMMNMSEKQW